MTGFGGVDDGVCVKVKHSLLKSRVTGGESGHKDVDATVVSFSVLKVG